MAQIAVPVNAGAAGAFRHGQDADGSQHFFDAIFVALHIFNAEHGRVGMFEDKVSFRPFAEANPAVLIPFAQPTLRGEADQRIGEGAHQVEGSISWAIGPRWTMGALRQVSGMWERLSVGARWCRY